MSEPKRYRLDPESYLAEHPQGDFVDYQDYARLKAKVERLRKAGDAMADWMDELGSPRAVPFFQAWNAAKEGKPSV
jgi:hypothetical protein